MAQFALNTAANTNAFASNPSATAATTSAFGASKPAPLFGSGAQQQQPSTSIFGTGSQPQQSNPLFGGAFTTQNQQQPGQQQQPQQSAFGSSVFANNTANASGTQQGSQPGQQPQQSAFGAFSSFQSNVNPGQQQQQQQQQPTNLWGTNTTNPLAPQATQPAGSSFFSNPNPNTGSSMFGAQQRPPQPQTLSSLGASTQQQPLFTKTTKFNDLPDQLKKIFEDIDSHIQGRVQISNDLKQLKLGEEAIKGQGVIRGLHKDLVNTTSIVHSDLQFTKDLKVKVDQAVQDTIAAARIIDGFKNPQQHGVYLKNYASFPLEYFNRITEQMRERLAWCKTTIEQIERKLSSSVAHAQYNPSGISATVQAQHAAFLNLASKTAALDMELKKIKTLYTQLWRAKTGSVRDPFEGVGGTEGESFGIDGLTVK